MFLRNYIKKVKRIRKYGRYISDKVEDIIQHTKHANNKILMSYPHRAEYETLSKALQDEGFNVEKWDRLPADFYAKFPNIVPIMITW